MNILAFDTSLDKMYVAVGTEQKVLSSKIVETTKEHYHSAFLISTIREVLVENNLTMSDIGLIVTNIGPGSFTGIRACTTVARVAAQANGAKVVGISSLEILSRMSNSEKTLVALDARKEMAYVAVYENKKEIFVPKALLVEDVKKMLEQEKISSIITDDKLVSILGGVSYQQSEDDLGKILIEISKEKLDSGLESGWRKLHPLYIQPPALNIKN